MWTFSRPSIYCFILLCLPVHVVVGQGLCGTHEEGKTMTLSCTSDGDTPFESLEPRFLIDGEYKKTASCDSDGNCRTTDQGRYIALFEKRYGKRKVSLHVRRVDRHMTTPRCYRDDEALYGVECHIQIYVKANKPVCEGPRFIDDNTRAVYTCTSDRVYPSGKCLFQLTSKQGYGDSHTPSHGLGDSHISWENTNSSKYKGDKAVECQLKLAVSGSKSGTYLFRAGITPDIDGITETATVLSGELNPLMLSPMALFNHYENGHVYSHTDTGYLRHEIRVTGNPWPNRISLSVRYGETSRETLLKKDGYTVEYHPSVDSVGGIISLNITGGLDRTKTNHFTLRAHNGVFEEEEFEYKFTVGDASDSGVYQETGLILGLTFAAVIAIVVIGVVIYVRRSRKNGVRGGIDNQAYECNFSSSTSDHACSVHYTASPYLTPTDPVPPPYDEEPTPEEFTNVYSEPMNPSTTPEADRKSKRYR